MREGWKEERIGDISVVGDGAHASLDREIDGILYLTSKNFSAEGIKLDKVEYISVENYNKYFKENSKALTKPKENDILLSIIGTIGAPYLVRANDTFGLSSSVSIIRPIQEKIYPNYLVYWIKSDYFQGSINNIKSGVAQSFLSLEMIRSLPCHYPPLPTQKKIAQILSAYDDLIENNLRRIKLLEEMAQITYEEWFVRFKFPGHENAKFDEETGLPEGWKRVKLAEVCELIMGQSPKSEFYNSEKKGLPFHQGVKDYGSRFPTNTMWSTDGNRFAKKGTILFSVRAPVGRLNIALEKIILGRGLASISYRNNWNGFLYYQLKQIFFEDNLMGGGAIFNSVTKNDMLRIELIEGDEKTMEEFNKIVKPIDVSIENLHNQNQRLKEAREILLPRLMTGVIDVEKMEVEL